jgi:hypothetical protein
MGLARRPLRNATVSSGITGVAVTCRSFRVPGWTTPHEGAHAVGGCGHSPDSGTSERHCEIFSGSMATDTTPDRCRRQPKRWSPRRNRVGRPRSPLPRGGRVLISSGGLAIQRTPDRPKGDLRGNRLPRCPYLHHQRQCGFQKRVERAGGESGSRGSSAGVRRQASGGSGADGRRDGRGPGAEPVSGCTGQSSRGDLPGRSHFAGRFSTM